MPIPDPAPRRSAQERLRLAQQKALTGEIVARMQRRGKRPGGEAGEAVPVDPHRPLDLSGGAAAALEFDD